MHAFNNIFFILDVYVVIYLLIFAPHFNISVQASVFLLLPSLFSFSFSFTHIPISRPLWADSERLQPITRRHVIWLLLKQMKRFFLAHTILCIFRSNGLYRHICSADSAFSQTNISNPDAYTKIYHLSRIKNINIAYIYIYRVVHRIFSYVVYLLFVSHCHHHIC